MPGSPLVSVIMPAHDAQKTIARSIASVLGQTFPEWELLIADDGSSDRTLQIARGAAADCRNIKVLRVDANQGAAVARNLALAKATGRYIAFLDADDTWHPEKLARQIVFMGETSAPMSCTAYIRRLPAGSKCIAEVPDSTTYKRLLRGNTVGCLTAMYDATKTGKIPMPLIKRRHDYALWLQIARDHGPIAGLNIPLAVHNVRPGSLSSDKLRASMDTWHMYRRLFGLSRWQATECLAAHIAGSVNREMRRAGKA